MRVIGGEYRSRLLKTLPGLETRPTPDRLRESLFNILAPEIEGVVFVDAYAGTGAVGIEALSRGARHAIFLERGRAAIAVIRENLRVLGAERRAEVVQGRVLQYLAHRRGDIVFLDPPYELAREYQGALELLAEAPPSLVIVQHSIRFELEDAYGRMERRRELKQGDNKLTFYRRRD
jgi:16S rRNA (guanine966-N2)-methyltransferase